MSTTTVTPAQASPDELAYREMLAKAKKQLVTIAKRETEARNQMEEAQAELARIEVYAAARDDQLLTVRTLVGNMRQQLEAAQNIAKLAVGTTLEVEKANDVMAIKKELAITEEQLEALEAKSEREVASEHERLTACQKVIASSQKTLEDCAERRQSIEDGQRQARAALVTKLCQDADIQMGYQEACEQQARAAVTEVLLAKEQIRDEIREQLKDYPEMWPHVEHLFIVDDTNTRSQAALIHYLRVLLEEKDTLPRDLPRAKTPALQKVQRAAEPYYDLFALGSGEILDLKNGAKRSRAHLEAAEAILNAYVKENKHP